MKRILTFFLIAAILMTSAGCDPLRKKFTRKKKDVKKMPRIYQLRKYEKKPTPELYKKHYSYWVTWQSELIRVLGDNRKKDKRCAEEIVGNLRDMQNILVDKKAQELEPHIVKMEDIREMIFNEELTMPNRDYIKRSLEREDRFIKREFCYKKVKDCLKKSFEDEAPPAGETVE